MKKDFSKLIFERGKVGGSKSQIRKNRHSTKNLCREAIDNDDVEIKNYKSMKKIHRENDFGTDAKESQYSFKPFLRFLESRIGKDWNEVQSEIVTNFQKDIGFGIKNRLLDTVVAKTYMSGDIVMGNGIFGPYPLSKPCYYKQFYVHPVTNLLCCTPKDNYWDKKSLTRKQLIDKIRYTDSENNRYFKVNNIWYKFSFREATTDELKYKKFGHPHSFYDPSVGGLVERFSEISQNNFVSQIVTTNSELFPYHMSYRMYGNLYEICVSLFGEPLLPVSKIQLNSKEVDFVKKGMQERDKKNSKKSH